MASKEEFSQGKRFGRILCDSVPAAISLRITAIYSIADRILVGHCNGTSAGRSACCPLSFPMLSFALTCSAGGQLKNPGGAVGAPPGFSS